MIKYKIFVLIFVSYICIFNTGLSQDNTYYYGAEGNCGNDCVLHALHLFNIPETSSGLLELSRNILLEGDKIISFYDMKQIFEAMGFYANAYNVSFESLDNISQNGIIICHYGENHFVVLEKIDNDKVSIFNPPLKIETIAKMSFIEKWNGNVLLVEKGEILSFKESFYPYPKLFCDVIYYDWGVLEKDAIVPVYFTLWNLGEEDLIISELDVSCNCSSSTLNKDTILCGENASLNISVDTKDKYHKQRIGAIIISNDPEIPEFKLNISGDIMRSREVIPSTVDFSVIPFNCSYTRIVSLQGTGMNNDNIYNVEISSDNIRLTEMVKYKKDYYRMGLKFETSWINKPGPFEEKITVYFKDDCFEPMEITVTGEYQSPVRLDPEAVFVEKGNDLVNIKGDIQLIIEKSFQREYIVEDVITDIPFLTANFKKNSEGYLIGYQGIAPKGENIPEDGKITIKGDNIPEEYRTVNIYFIPSGG